MTRRAKYNGPFEEVRVDLGEGDVNANEWATVKRGGLLPADAPARVRDSLLTTDEWSEVNQADQPKAAAPSDTKDEG